MLPHGLHFLISSYETTIGRIVYFMDFVITVVEL